VIYLLRSHFVMRESEKEVVVGSGYDFYILKSHSGYPVLHTGGGFIVMKLNIEDCKKNIFKFSMNNSIVNLSRMCEYIIWIKIIPRKIH